MERSIKQYMKYFNFRSKIQLDHPVQMSLESVNLVPNTDEFECPICFDDYEPGEGVVLRECFHTFCK